jgi:hypothetical protein
MPKPLIGQRVYDSIGDDYGTVIVVDARGRCLIEWDRRPPNEPPFIKIPNDWCAFVEESPRGALIDGTGSPTPHT